MPTQFQAGRYAASRPTTRSSTCSAVADVRTSASTLARRSVSDTYSGVYSRTIIHRSIAGAGGAMQRDWVDSDDWGDAFAVACVCCDCGRRFERLVRREPENVRRCLSCDAQFVRRISGRLLNEVFGAVQIEDLLEGT